MRDLGAYLDKIAYLCDLADGAERLIVTLTSVPDGTMLWVSPDGLRSVLGYDPEDIVGTPGPSLLASRSQTSEFDDALAVVGAGETTAGWYDAEHKTGRRVLLRVTAWRITPDVAVSLAVPEEGEPAASRRGPRAARNPADGGTARLRDAAG